MHTAGECLFYGNVSGQKAIELCHFLLLKKKVCTTLMRKSRLTGVENKLVVIRGEEGEGHNRGRGLRGTNCSV